MRGAWATRGRLNFWDGFAALAFAADFGDMHLLGALRRRIVNDDL